MKVAVTSKGKEPDSALDPRFGRGFGFLIYDDETGKFEFIANSDSASQVQGAGVKAAQKVVDADVDALISGNVGPKAFDVLRAAGIKVYLCSEDKTVKEALELFKEGKLEEVSSPNVGGHW